MVSISSLDRQWSRRIEHPSPFDSFQGFQPWKNEIFGNKKRKLQITDQLSFQAPKLQHCWVPSSSSEGNFKFDRNPEEEEGNLVGKVQEKPDFIDVNEISKEEVPLENERNGSKFHEDELQTGYGHQEDLLEFEIHGNTNSSKEQHCSHNTEGLKHDFVLSSGRWKVNPDLTELGNHGNSSAELYSSNNAEPLLLPRETRWDEVNPDLRDHGSHGNSNRDQHCSHSAEDLPGPKESENDFVLSSGRWKVDSAPRTHEEDHVELRSHGNGSIMQYCSNGTESLLLPSDSKHEFVLSSGRWKVNREDESETINPTIDLEFEQYFSVLMPPFDS